MEQKILCATFLEAVLRFYEDPKNRDALSGGVREKEEMLLNKRTAEQLRRDYPDYVPLDVAAKYLGVSRRQLSWLIAEGRAPYASIGGNIGKKQRYVRVYTEPLIDLLCGSDHIDQDDIDQ